MIKKNLLFTIPIDNFYSQEPEKSPNQYQSNHTQFLNPNFDQEQVQYLKQDFEIIFEKNKKQKRYNYSAAFSNPQPKFNNQYQNSFYPSFFQSQNTRNNFVQNSFPQNNKCFFGSNAEENTDLGNKEFNKQFMNNNVNFPFYENRYISCNQKNSKIFQKPINPPNFLSNRSSDLPMTKSSFESAVISVCDNSTGDEKSNSFTLKNLTYNQNQNLNINFFSKNQNINNNNAYLNIVPNHQTKRYFENINLDIENNNENLINLQELNQDLPFNDNSNSRINNYFNINNLNKKIINSDSNFQNPKFQAINKSINDLNNKNSFKITELILANNHKDSIEFPNEKYSVDRKVSEFSNETINNNLCNFSCEKYDSTLEKVIDIKNSTGQVIGENLKIKDDSGKKKITEIFKINWSKYIDIFKKFSLNSYKELLKRPYGNKNSNEILKNEKKALKLNKKNKNKNKAKKNSKIKKEALLNCSNKTNYENITYSCSNVKNIIINPKTKKNLSSNSVFNLISPINANFSSSIIKLDESVKVSENFSSVYKEANMTEISSHKNFSGNLSDITNCSFIDPFDERQHIHQEQYFNFNNINKNNIINSKKKCENVNLNSKEDGKVLHSHEKKKETENFQNNSYFDVTLKCNNKKNKKKKKKKKKK